MNLLQQTKPRKPMALRVRSTKEQRHAEEIAQNSIRLISWQTRWARRFGELPGSAQG